MYRLTLRADRRSGRRSRPTLALALAALAMAASACGGHKNYVQVDDVALGRVVVYRNGVAYYERRAELHNDELTVTVPRDRVDDFLKSLTVVDAKTGEALPVSFPRQQVKGNYLEMKLKLPKTDATSDVVLTYVTEAPAWKPSYRVVVGADKRVLLEGWAIVDNTSAEDWKDVKVGVGSSSALSFRYDLWSVRTVHRETLGGEESFAVAPPTGASPYNSTGQGQPIAIAQLDDGEIRRPDAHPESEPDDDYGDMMESEPAAGGREYTTSIDSAGSTASASPSARWQGNRKTATKAADKPVREQQYQSGDAKIRAMAEALSKNRNVVVIEGYAGPGESEPDKKALDRANVIRNQLIDEGVPPAQLRVVAKGAVDGRAPGVKLVAGEPLEQSGEDGAPVKFSDRPVGESHFQSDKPMSVPRGTSIMISMVRKATDGEVVYLYDAESERGNDRFAFKAVRLRNPTDSTLETGPVTVYGDGRFIGEGLADPIPPRASAVVPFALDRQIMVEPSRDIEDRIAKIVTVERGIATTQMKHIRNTHLKITSRLRDTARVFVRHTVQQGWSLIESPKVHERLGDAHLFSVEVKGGETVMVKISEETPIERTIDLGSKTGIDLVSTFIGISDPGDNAFGQALANILTLHREQANLAQELMSQRSRLADFRTRMDELHGQILTLQALKTRGELMKHLKQKMEEVSNRVQIGTIAIVDLEEKLMLSRIRLQDALAELRLTPA